MLVWMLFRYINCINKVVPAYMHSFMTNWFITMSRVLSLYSQN